MDLKQTQAILGLKHAQLTNPWLQELHGPMGTHVRKPLASPLSKSGFQITR